MKTGLLRPLREFVLQDRDLLLEIRSGYVDLYFKGNGLLNIKAQHDRSEYIVSTHEKFAGDLNNVILKSHQDVVNLVESLPNIKHNISIHKPYASEIEMEHFFIRMNNREPGVNSEYFAIDRQGIYGPQNGRVDILGVFWPRADRRNSEKLDLCVMEMKFAMGAEIGQLAAQLQKYYDILAGDLTQIAADAEALLRDKIDLGLFGTNKRLDVLRQLKISDKIEDVGCIVVLAEQNPFSRAMQPNSLLSVPFNRIEIFRVGYGLWSCDAYTLKDDKWKRPATFGEIN